VATWDLHLHPPWLKLRIILRLCGARPVTANDSFSERLKLAFDHHNAGRHAEAEAICRDLTQSRPRDAQVLFLLGMVLHKTGRDDEAVARLNEAAEVDPRSARVFHGLGCAYQSLGDFQRAAGSFRHAIGLDPKSADLHYSLGNCLYKLGEIERAADCYRAAVDVSPADEASACNFGKCLQELNRVEESIAVYDRLLAANPEHVMARYGRAISCLMAGRLREGYRDYECRWGRLPPRPFAKPRWEGEALPDKTLFVHAEQGFGDAIQNVRLVRLARRLAGRVVLECRPELKRLFQWSECAHTVISHGEPVPDFDCYVSLQSLPVRLGIELDTIPAKVPYLAAPPAENFVPVAGRLNVGLVWAGNPGHSDDAERSLRLEQLAPILAVPGVAFHSLQRPIPVRDESLLRSSPIADSVRYVADFLDTASVVNDMDLVIAVDTAVAHLAGALARPVWMMARQPADWRWMLDREDSPWYPTMRIFRQARRDDWTPVIDRVAAELRGLAAGKASSRA
jgi:tetratricopeptide (TPR) repeat protein